MALKHSVIILLLYGPGCAKQRKHARMGSLWPGHTRTGLHLSHTTWPHDLQWCLSNPNQKPRTARESVYKSTATRHGTKRLKEHTSVTAANSIEQSYRRLNRENENPHRMQALWSLSLAHAAFDTRRRGAAFASDLAPAQSPNVKVTREQATRYQKACWGVPLILRFQRNGSWHHLWARSRQVGAEVSSISGGGIGANSVRSVRWHAPFE